MVQKPEADEDIIKDACGRIEAAARKMDCDGLESVFEEIDAYRIPEGQADLFKKLKAASDRFEYSKILELLGNV